MPQMSFDEADQLREFFFTVLESLPNGVLFADRHGNLLAINQKARKLLGLGSRSIIQQSSWEIMRQTLGVSRVELAKLEVPGARVLCQVAAPDGTKRYLSIARNELNSPFVGISGFFLALEDVTYLAMAEAQLDRQKRFAAMQEMAVSMSQELKNPLGSLELYASILQRELTGEPDNARLATRMISAIRTMDHLLDNYVTFAALPEPRPAWLAVEAWLEEALDSVRQLDRAKACRFSTSYGHSEPGIVGDSALLHQLAVNLLVNAVESMADGGPVEVATRSLPAEEGRPALLEVRFTDAGSGIADEQLPRIFDPFFTTKERASGLGLAIAHYVVEKHGGLMEVANNSGGGATFRVLLPAAGDGRP